MNFWWVNHNQTFRHEFQGGYIWSPKVNAVGKHNPFYDFMRRVCPGDIIFSFSDTRIQGVGIASSHCYTSPRPDEFGHIGRVWDLIGWRVDVTFRPFHNRIRPKDHISTLQRFLPTKYSPLQQNGNGNQAVYLTLLSRVLAEVLSGLIGTEAVAYTRTSIRESTEPLFEIELKGIDEWEDVQIQMLNESDISETDRRALIKARVGQGRFKQNVARLETRCRITGVTNPTHLVASHIKPWRESSNEERLAAGNGLLLTPTIDHLFDRGFITFDDDGGTHISQIADQDALRRMGIDPNALPAVGSFHSEQKHFLEHHRSSIFLL
jgi:hypothetical protein